MRGNCSFMDSGKTGAIGTENKGDFIKLQNRTFDPSPNYCTEQTMELFVCNFFFFLNRHFK